MSNSKNVVSELVVRAIGLVFKNVDKREVFDIPSATTPKGKWARQVFGNIVCKGFQLKSSQTANVFMIPIRDKNQLVIVLVDTQNAQKSIGQAVLEVVEVIDSSYQYNFSYEPAAGVAKGNAAKFTEEDVKSLMNELLLLERKLEAAN